MLLNNRWFGPGLKQWQRSKTVTLTTQRSVSIAILQQSRKPIMNNQNRGGPHCWIDLCAIRPTVARRMAK
jgi:hypothetical protein